MKKFKNLFTLFIMLLTASICHAQSAESIANKVQVGVNIEGAFPTGDFSKAYSFGIGGSLMGRYPLSDKAKLTASLGYLNFSGKSITETYESDGGPQTETYKAPSMYGVPLRVGANYLLGTTIFVQGEIGAAFMKGGTAFLYTPGIGARFSNLEVEAKYEGWSRNGTLSFFGIRAGYFF
ncbi:MAG: hypothetical protein ABI308_16180 [Mucilaginibacter sp.]